MEHSEPPATPPPQRRSIPPRRSLFGSGAFVRSAVGLSILLAAALIASLYVHWHRLREPTTAVVIIGDTSWKGTEIVVTPVGAANPEGRRVQVVLDERNSYQTPVFELPGRYQVTATLHERTLAEYTVDLDRSHYVQIDLPTPVEVIGDPSLDGGRVLLSSREQTYSGAFTAADRHRVTFLVQGGEFSLEVSRDGQVIDHAEFAVTSHVPRQVDLRRHD